MTNQKCMISFWGFFCNLIYSVDIQRVNALLHDHYWHTLILFMYSYLVESVSILSPLSKDCVVLFWKGFVDVKYG